MNRVRVLVVDDEEDFATAVTERLIRRGFDATAALSGARALELLEESRFDVVTLDLKMPGMDGLTTLRARHREAFGGSLRVGRSRGVETTGEYD